MLLLINAEKLHWLLLQLPINHYSQFSWKCFAGMRRHDMELLVLTWLHHVGMGPSEGGKQQADKHRLSSVCAHRYMCIFLPSDVRETTHWLWDVRCLCIRKSSFSRVRHSAYQCLLVALWLCFSLQLSRPTFLFPFLPVRVCVCVFPEGKIRHELWKQPRQSCSTLQTAEWNNCLFRGWPGGRYRC